MVISSTFKGILSHHMYALAIGSQSMGR